MQWSKQELKSVILTDGICEALEMSKKEQTRRMRTMQKRLSRIHLNHFKF